MDLLQVQDIAMNLQKHTSERLYDCWIPDKTLKIHFTDANLDIEIHNKRSMYH